ncbi:MAG: NADH-quinone oxidoreductase subunit NuoE [Actinomycetota bacterium]|nr:NADH-quinone oxidoreductase subunit NuoE [Actinomycetota bacterium]MDI6822254.1 NADH-quinone oxidoreductase subunit NuoE [Actinomycetota bacterium]
MLDKHGDDAGSLIPILQKAQNAYGYLSQEILDQISKETRIPLSQIYGVVTFYAQFRLHAHGEHVIKVCHGTACHVSGAEDISLTLSEELGIESGETTKDRKFTLETVACLGCCSLAPVVMVDEMVYGRLTPGKAREVIRR